MTDIVERLSDLIVQATHERSHYYVAKTAQDASYEIERLRGLLREISQLVMFTTGALVIGGSLKARIDAALADRESAP